MKYLYIFESGDFKLSNPPQECDFECVRNGYLSIIDLSDKNLWPHLPKSIGSFEQLAYQEFKLAARMDSLACRRLLTAKKFQSGKIVTKSELQRLERLMNHISDDFKKLWLMRNKLSRLNDNLRLFKQAKIESCRLAEKR